MTVLSLVPSKLQCDQIKPDIYTFQQFLHSFRHPTFYVQHNTFINHGYI